MTSCEGFIFYQYNRGLFNYKVEYFLLRLAKIKIGVIPYGGDAHIYRRIQNPKWLAGLLTDYPKQALIQNDISERVDFYVEKADIFLPGSAIFDGFGRADRISANTLCIDTDLWSPTSKSIRKTIVISHTPNHRKIKGTQLIIEAVSQLKAEGFNVELKLIEGKSNEDVRIALQGSSDIHIDQLNSDCYGLSAIESMALGIPTLSSFGGAVREFFNEWSFSKNCPIVDINSGTLLENLRTLIENDNYRDDLSIRSRQYVLDYHSYEYFARFFEEILESKSIILKSNGTFK
jgi:glycosyltransferase involved in cell wall biosynthesis